MTRSILIGIAAILLSGCDKPKRGPANVEEIKAMICGSYQGQYNHGIEYIEIRSVGTFSQRFVQRGVTIYDLEGKWSLERMQDHWLVRFEPFMDLEMAILKAQSPKRITGREAAFYEDESKIWFFRDIDYFITKRSDKADTNRRDK